MNRGGREMRTNMKWLLVVLGIGMMTTVGAKDDGKVYLLVRGDDMGSSHAANLACLDSYTNGIMRSVEVMPACPWFLEAAQMLNQHPGLDVGIHLALTSEWSLYKWKPLTYCPSLTDEDGYFFPMVWRNENFPPHSSIQESDWKIEEAERELRAQIELAMKHIPHITHMNSHMGFSHFDERLAALMEKLAKEYGLDIDSGGYGLELGRFEGWKGAERFEDWEDRFCANLRKLEPGTYRFIEHPSYNHPEMQPIMHIGYENVGEEREWVTRVFTSEKVKQTIAEEGIILVSWKDLSGRD